MLKIKIGKLIKPIILLGAFMAASSAGAWNPANYVTTGLPTGSVYDIVSTISLWLLGLFGFIGVIGFVISGILYLTAAGDAEQEKKAKKAMTMSIIGIVVGLGGLVAIQWADNLLFGDTTTF